MVQLPNIGNIMEILAMVPKDSHYQHRVAVISENVGIMNHL